MGKAYALLMLSAILIALAIHLHFRMLAYTAVVLLYGGISFFLLRWIYRHRESVGVLFKCVVSFLIMMVLVSAIGATFWSLGVTIPSLLAALAAFCFLSYLSDKRA
jgi:hypothetical protein